MSSSLRVLVAAIALAASGIGACDTCGGSSGGGSTSGDGSSAAGESPSGSASAPEMIVEADAASPCSGSAIDLAAVVSDPTCAITSGIAKSTRAMFEVAVDAGRQSLRQKAIRLDDGRVELRLVNEGTLATTVPLSWHPKIPAFIVLADSAKEKAIYELEAPALAVELDGGPATARFARATIAPGGHAFARIAIDPKIVKRAGSTAATDGGRDAAAMPAKITEGRWTLHIGQLVTDVFTGEPASLAWNVEATD